MSLALRRTLYFKGALTATYRMSPVPSSAREVEHIHRSFSKVAPIEYFFVEPASASEQNLYRRNLTVVFNSWDHASLLNLHSPLDSAHHQSAGHLNQRRDELRAYLLSICGIPRYSYIEEDLDFSAGKTEIRFSHTLAKEYVGAYTISASTEKNPFFTIQSHHPTTNIVPLLRHNFQKIHKLMPLSVRPGLPNHLKPSHSPDVAVNVSPDAALDLPALTNLDHDLGFDEPTKSSRHFRGFQI